MYRLNPILAFACCLSTMGTGWAFSQTTKPPRSAVQPASAAEPAHLRQRAESLVRRLLEPAHLSQSALKLHPPRHIRPKTSMWTEDLPDIWEVRFELGETGGGHLFLSATEEMILEEFAFDSSKPVPPLHGDWVPGVPNLQQFPIPSPSGKGRTASGCVPTAGASLIGFWAARAHPGWLDSGTAHPAAQAEQDALRAATLRLRKSMRMIEIRDKEGYADGTMSLSGSTPEELAKALARDARERNVPVRVQVNDFSVEDLRTEIRAGRPALVTCVVRLPHKPDLAWGHQLVAVGCQQVEDFDYVGVVDNFYPVRNATTVRWIEKGVFGSLLTVRPGAEEGGKADQKNTP